MNEYYWKTQTAIGEAKIYRQEELWRISLSGEDLGGYEHPQHALDDLAGGHAHPHPRCPDTSVLAIPTELSGWEFAEV